MNDIGSTLASAVIFLFAQSQTGRVPIGTAFIVGYPVPGQPAQYIPLVVTAKHVLADHAKVYGRFSTQSGEATASAEYDLDALRRRGEYWEHSDPGVDLAVFRTPHFKDAKYTVVPLSVIATREDFRTHNIQTTDRVVLPGLLMNFMGLSRNYPIIRNGSIALIPDEAIPMRYRVGSRTIETRQEALLVDATAVPGESGSPVFLWPGPRIANGKFNIGSTRLMLGVLHGFYPAQPREVVSVPADTKQMFAENSNIAIVFPSWRLREIVDSKAVDDHFKRLVAEQK